MKPLSERGLVILSVACLIALAYFITMLGAAVMRQAEPIQQEERVIGVCSERSDDFSIRACIESQQSR